MRIEMDLEESEVAYFESSPQKFMAQKMRSGELSFNKLNDEDRKLFMEAKAREVSEFIAGEATRLCLDQAEVDQAWNSQRIIRARWLLTWKRIKPEERPQAMSKRDAEIKSGGTTINADGSQKARARLEFPTNFCLTLASLFGW